MTILIVVIDSIVFSHSTIALWLKFDKKWWYWNWWWCWSSKPLQWVGVWFDSLSLISIILTECMYVLSGFRLSPLAIPSKIRLNQTSVFIGQELLGIFGPLGQCWHLDTFAHQQWQTSKFLCPLLIQGLALLRKFLFKCLLGKSNFLTWLLICWQKSWMSIRSHIR